MMPVLNAAERQKQTVDLLLQQGRASVSKLSQEFGVSEVTVRKDLRALERRNVLVRTYGGAVLTDHYLYDLPFDEKAQRHAAEKKRLGRAAAARVEDGDTILINAGSTMVQVAKHLRGKKNLTVTTNALHVASELVGNVEVDLHMLGGQVRATTATTVGPYAEQMLQDHSFRKFFLGGDGFDVAYGITNTNPMEAHLYRRMVQSAKETIVVMDASKFGRQALSRICGIEDVNAVITDSRIDQQTVSLLERANIEVIVA